MDDENKSKTIMFLYDFFILAVISLIIVLFFIYYPIYQQGGKYCTKMLDVNITNTTHCSAYRCFRNIENQNRFNEYIEGNYVPLQEVYINNDGIVSYNPENWQNYYDYMKILNETSKVIIDKRFCKNGK